jgi:hypothetical protein
MQWPTNVIPRTHKYPLGGAHIRCKWAVLQTHIVCKWAHIRCQEPTNIRFGSHSLQIAELLKTAYVERSSAFNGAGAGVENPLVFSL